jgi:uncharacterized glyoxalase superfamily protein PhnB
MKPTPPGWPRMSTSVHYRDPAAAIDWLCSAFGFELRLKVEDDRGQIVHSELGFAEGLVMVGGTGRSDPGKEAWQSLQRSPRDVGGGHTQSVCIFVDDADAHCEVARARGARIVREPRTDDYGDDYWADRSYGCLDPEGHLWWFMERVRTGPKS